MFCSESIIAAYEGRSEYENINGENSFFDCYHELAYHATERRRIVLETEHYYISLRVSGVSIDEKNSAIEEFEEKGEWLRPYIEPAYNEGDLSWVNYESTLFVGERLLNVENREEDYLLQFDHFQLRVVPHPLDEEDFPSLKNENHWSYNHVLGTEHKITAKCPCGGEGELLMDFVSDYLIRCKKCKRSTWAQMNAIDAIEEWNDGNLECDASDIVIE